MTSLVSLITDYETGHLISSSTNCTSNGKNGSDVSIKINIGNGRFFFSSNGD